MKPWARLSAGRPEAWIAVLRSERARPQVAAEATSSEGAGIVGGSGGGTWTDFFKRGNIQSFLNFNNVLGSAEFLCLRVMHNCHARQLHVSSPASFMLIRLQKDMLTITHMCMSAHNVVTIFYEISSFHSLTQDR